MSDTLPPHLTQHWHLTKPAASGRRGMVVSQSRDAALAGVAVLDAGGNAVDAAVATALALAALEPWNSGLGGIGFALVHRAGQSRAEVVDFGPRAPAKLDPSRFKLTGEIDTDLFAWPKVEGDANVHGPLSCRDPRRDRRLRLHARALGRPAARRGDRAGAGPGRAWPAAGLVHHPQDRQLAPPSCASMRRAPASTSRTACRRCRPTRAAPASSGSAISPDTLDRLAAAGLRDFYEGDVAASIAARCRRARRRLWTASDLRGCQARITPPQEVPFAGRTLQLAGGLTASPTMARVLEQMAAEPFGDRPGAAWFAALARAMKRAYAERLAGLGDAEPMAAESCTTHLTVCDAEGGMVVDDHDPTVQHGQQGGPARLRRAAQQRRHVVRPAAGPAELARPRQAPAHQHAAHHPA